MPKFNFEIDKTFTWSVDIEADNQQEAEAIMDDKLSNEYFDLDNAQEGYLEIVDCSEIK